ncbi:HXXEE domain-containing protein [Alkalicoccobacillus gibsonii]|uniref:HXXEE domain-containing protein n=1 Tax=Alkalicoccobacillus gibsonii TaxID=79881 RepID=UPI003F7CA2B7
MIESTFLWLFIVVFMVHDFEEIITVEHWAEKRKSLLESKWAKRIWSFWNIRSNEFAKRDVVIFLFVSMLVLLRVEFTSVPGVEMGFQVFLWIVLIHNLVHLIQTCVTRTYTPGLYTAIILVTPYTLFLLINL